ncbi:MAG: hypothetical protein HY721_20065 [Planctomycetes bacterium]|nr:hypothetical protein [Planctomycetota bacterium]
MASAVAALLLAGPIGAQVVDCPIPAPGVQTTPSRAMVTVINPQGLSEVVTLQGDTSISHGALGRDGTIPIEIVGMSLTGSASFGDVVLTTNKTMPSRGTASNVVCQPGPGGQPTAHVDSFFDVFIEVRSGDFLLHNATPITMRSRKPVPLDHTLPGVLLAQANPPVDLLDANNRPTGLRVGSTEHELIPPPPPPPCYPLAGKDIMDSVLLHDIDIPGIGLIRGDLKGPVTVMRSDPKTDPATGLTCIDTEIVALELTGMDPVVGTVRATLNPFRKSTGTICEKVAGTCFPAISCFEVYVLIELPDLGLCLYACDPAKMCCEISAIPPFGCLYNLNIGGGIAPVPLYRGACGAANLDPCTQVPLPPPAAYIVKAIHQPLPPKVCECFPKAGYDTLLTTLAHTIDIPGLQIQCQRFTGPIVIRRGDPYLNDQGLCCIKTEVVRLDMKGACTNGATAVIRLCPDRPSRGLICGKEPGKCFPANSCFEIFFEVTVTLPDGTQFVLKNCKPAIMCCMIDALPPIGCPYALQNGPIDLFRVVPGQVLCDPARPADGVLREATHTPEEPARPCCPEYGPGRDILETQLLHDIEIPGIGHCAANLAGPVVVERGTAYVDPATGMCCVETRMVSMLLEGEDAACGGRIRISLDPRHESKGQICSKQRTACFPANSCFDVRVRIELLDLGITLVLCAPARMCCMIDALPPFGCLYQLDLGPGDTVPLYEDKTAVAVTDTAGAGGGLPPSCVIPDNGTGTVDLPPANCGYVSPEDLHMIIDGLPAGTTINVGAQHLEFFNIVRKPGGNLGGEAETFRSILGLEMNGTGTLAGFHRTLAVQADCETHVGPRTPGDPVQSFDTDMFRLQGQIVGDPDFDLLRIVAGTGFGLPSPGHTTLTQLPGGSWNVDSFFDITYRIDFVGAPGGPLAGRSGSTTGTIRMGAGQPAPPPTNACQVADDGTGTVSLPPPGCEYLSPDEVHRIIDGLPAGTTIELAPIHREFICRQGGTDPHCGNPGGSLGGEVEVFSSMLQFDLHGTGELATFARMIDIPNVTCETHTAPRMPGDPVQSFDTDMFRLQGQLPPGDPDFDLLRVTAGTGFGMPSPGHTTLTQLPNGNWNVDSFFDITYRIDFVGAPGGPLAGRSGSTTATIRMQTGVGGGGPQPTDPCLQSPLPNPRAFIVKAVHRPEPPCTFPDVPPAGDDTLQSELSHRVRIFAPGGEVVVDADMHGPVTVRRSPIAVDPVTGLCEIPTEMLSLDLRGMDPVLGEVRIRESPTKASTGRIRQGAANPRDQFFPADSFFDVFVEVSAMAGGQTTTLGNCAPARMESVIHSIPPYDQLYVLNLSEVQLYRPEQCALLPSPNVQPSGVIEAADHVVRKPCDCPYGPGVDTMDSLLRHRIVVPGLLDCTPSLRGVVKVERGEPYIGPDGLCCVNTRMLELSLSGDDDVCGHVEITLAPDRPTRGKICQTAVGACFPALSCFEVFIDVKVTLPGGRTILLTNCKPVVMCCEISSLPPYGCVYEPRLGGVQLYRQGSCDDPAAQPVGEVIGVGHIPEPCGPRAIACSTAADGTVTVTVTEDPRCPCEGRTVITRSIDGGPPVAIGAAGAVTLTDTPCAGLPVGIHTVKYCAKCVTPDGVESAEVCCETKCEVPPPPCVDCIESVKCQVVGGQVIVSWSLKPNCRDCARFLVLHNGAVVQTVAGGVLQSQPLPCEPGEYSVVCVCADGSTHVAHTCTVRPEDCPRPCEDCIESARCQVVEGKVVVSWAFKPGCTDCVRVAVQHNGVEVAVAPVAVTSSVTLPCEPGEYCVQCICADGTRHGTHCCTVRPEECKRARQLPCDCNQDGRLDISDGICLLGFLFLGNPATLPCFSQEANAAVFDCTGDGGIDLTDAIKIFNYLFLGGPPPQGCLDPECKRCIEVTDCPDNAKCL